MPNTLCTASDEPPELALGRAENIVVVPFGAKASADNVRLFKIAETLLIGLQHQLALLAKSAHFAGNADIARCAKLALGLSSQIQYDLRAHTPYQHRRDGQAADLKSGVVRTIR